MQITVSQLQTKHGLLVAALKRGEPVELTYHGKVLGVVQPNSNVIEGDDALSAMDEFFGMHKERGVGSVEEEIRQVRRGRVHRDVV